MLVVAATDRELASVRGVDTWNCGIGPVEAALQTARALAELKPDAVLHIGIAGARGIAAPALVLGSESVYCDVIDPSSLLKRIARIQPDPELFARVHAALPDAYVLPIATAGKVGAGTDREVEAMEDFGVFRACSPVFRRSSCGPCRTHPMRQTAGRGASRTRSRRSATPLRACSPRRPARSPRSASIAAR